MMLDKDERRQEYERIMEMDITLMDALVVAITSVELMTRMRSTSHVPQLGMYEPNVALGIRTKEFLQQMLEAENARLSALREGQR